MSASPAPCLVRPILDDEREELGRRVAASWGSLDALRFYQRRGLRLVRIWPGSVDRSRLRKPEIPLKGNYGISISDEIALELNLDAGPVIRADDLADSNDETRGGSGFRHVEASGRVLAGPDRGSERSRIGSYEEVARPGLRPRNG